MLHNTIGITVYNMFTAGNAETITRTLDGALYAPDTSNCYSDFAGTACTYDKKVALTWGSPEADRYGPELVANGGFDSATGWTKSLGTAIAYGVCRIVSDGAIQNVYPSVNNLLVAGKLYKCEIVISDATSGVLVFSDAVGSASFAPISTVGTKTFYFVATDAGWMVKRGSACDISVDNISVREVVGYAAWQATTNYQPYLRSANYSELPFTSGTGETWTTTRTWIDDAGGIEWENGEAYWRNSAGTAGNYVSTPDSAAASITGDGTWIFDGALVDWTPAAIGGPVSKISGTTGEYGVSVLTDGTLRLTWYVAGVAKTATSTAAIGATDAAGCAIKVVRTIGVKVQFYKATDFNRATRTGTWAQIGSDVANTDAAAQIAANAVLIGALTTAANPASGKIHYAAAWGNTTGSGTPAWEFYPARDAVKPASPWLDFDGTNDYLISSIIPGNYSTGFVCSGTVQTEALGGTNVFFGSSASNAVRGVQNAIISTGALNQQRLDGTTNISNSTANFITQNVPFVATVNYAINSSSSQINSGTKATSAVTRNYTGTTQYALIGAANNTESGVTPTNYLQGHIHALAWLPVIPTEAQETAIRSYIASKAGVTL